MGLQEEAGGHVREEEWREKPGQRGRAVCFSNTNHNIDMIQGSMVGVASAAVGTSAA